MCLYVREFLLNLDCVVSDKFLILLLLFQDVLAEMLCVFNFRIVCLVFRSRNTCNMTSVSSINIAQMVGIEKHATTVDQDSKLCSTGIKVETSVPVNNQHTTTATMTLVSQ